MILPIYVYGADVLRQRAKEIELDSPEIKERISKLIDDMWETMENADGVGLAAPQIGESIRLLIVDGTLLADEMPELKDFKRVMINPVIIEESSQTCEYNEGCLSVPDINAVVERVKSIKIKYLDRDFNEKEELLDNFACRMVLHEMDHLNGVLFTDHATPIRKKMIQSKLIKIKDGKVIPHYRIK